MKHPVRVSLPAKVMGQIPLDDDNSRDVNARSFNLLRLREIAHQRDQTAKTFEGHKDNQGEDGEKSAGRLNSPLSKGYRQSFHDLRLKKSSLSSTASVSSSTIERTTLLRIRDDGGTGGSDGDDENDEDEVDFGLRISPAPRVTFINQKSNPSKKCYATNLRGRLDDLVIEPSASVASPESPFASPSKKKNSFSQQMLLTSKTSPDLTSVPLNETPHFGSFGVHREIGEDIMAISGHGAGASHEIAAPGAADESGGAAHHNHRRKIGGGAVVVTSLPTSLQAAEYRIQRNNSSQAAKTPALSIVDFSVMAQRGSPEKEKRRKT